MCVRSSQHSISIATTYTLECISIKEIECRYVPTRSKYYESSLNNAMLGDFLFHIETDFRLVFLCMQ